MWTVDYVYYRINTVVKVLLHLTTLYLEHEGPEYGKRLLLKCSVAKNWML